MATTHHRVANYPVHSIPLTRPFIWLREGWVDLSHHRSSSLAYGLLVSVLGSLILAYDRHPFYIAAMTAGFLLVGPIMTAGLCELSRCWGTPPGGPTVNWWNNNQYLFPYDLFR